MRKVSTLRIKQLSSIKDRGESIKNREYFLEFEARFEKPSDMYRVRGLGETKNSLDRHLKLMKAAFLSRLCEVNRAVPSIF
jgi:hypothetical protein